MSSHKSIICGVSNWFWIRALAVFLLFAAMTFWFLFDYKFGYPKKNYKYVAYQTFVEAKKTFEEFTGKGASAEEWNAYALEQPLSYPEDLSVIPEKKLGQKWPKQLQDYDAYSEQYAEYKNSADPPMWREFTAEKKWGDNRPDHLYERGQINEQLGWAIGASLIGLGVIGYCIRMRGRKFVAEENEFITPAGKKIAYQDIYKIDKRKWETKGLATVYYKEGAVDKSVKIDGMVYGQFKDEDGQPAEKLFQRVLANFKGELIELIEQDETEQTEDVVPKEG